MKTEINNISVKILNMVPKGKREEMGKLIDNLINECEDAFSVKTLKNPFDNINYDNYNSEEEE